MSSKYKRKDFPKIVHLMYFPWDRQQRLKTDEFDFDKTCYEQMKASCPNWEIKLWTVSSVKAFADESYPGLWDEIWSKIERPTQAVDFFRLLVTYHFGGIYWQYDSKLMCPMEFFIPFGNRRLMLFIEAIYSKEQTSKFSKHAIRNGKPEEQIRICNQIFSAYKNDVFLKYCIDKSISNLNKYKVVCDYDILYIGANAMISEAYDEYATTPSKANPIVLVPIKMHQRMFSVSSKGSWRTDIG